MKYNHPTDIPLSKTLFFDWIGTRIPLADMNASGDTHPQTWADDDQIYIGTGDPLWYEKDGKHIHMASSGGEDISSKEAYAKMWGQVVERLTGEPETFGLKRVHDMPGYVGGGGNGPKPCGMICVDGVLYYAVQNLLGTKTPPNRINSQHGTDATIICSKDHGKTWDPELNDLLKEYREQLWDDENKVWRISETERKGFKGWSPMFLGSEFGGPSFVQFGKNNADAIDEYVYAISADQWDNGRYLRLGRVHKNRIPDRSEWEFAAFDKNKDASCNRVVWKKNLEDTDPILDIEGHISLPEMVYIPALKKYILLTWGLHNDFYSPTGSELTILESDNIWGPFNLLHYEWMWDDRARCPYNPRIPLKWFDQTSLEGYILHSGSWGYRMPDGSWRSFHEYYRPTLRKFRFSHRDDPLSGNSIQANN